MAEEEDQTDDTLSNHFDRAFSLYKELEDTDLSSNDVKYQAKVKEAMALLEKATEMVNQLEVFSKNECVEDVSTENMKYLLLPAFLGHFSSKLSGKPRKECIEIAEIYYKDYLQRIRSYSICPQAFFPEETENDGDDHEDEDDNKIQSLNIIKQMALDRHKKIEAYKNQKKLASRLDELETFVTKFKSKSDANEKVREYYLVLIEKWIGIAKDELVSIKREKRILDQMPTPVEKKKPTERAPPLKPFIIVRNKVQEKMYGLGYPSIPTMTIEEFVNSKIKEGSLSVTQPGQSNSLLEWSQNPDLKKQQEEDDASKKEREEEIEDLEAVKKAREWDEFKDENTRGWGNRYNRS